MKRLLIVAFLLILTVAVAHAQVSSAAFDPNCYFPRIGVPGEIDTVMGSHAEQYLGTDIKNIGPFLDSSYGRISCSIDFRDSVEKIFTTGPGFNLHKLTIAGNFLNIQSYYFVRFGHFHNSKRLDILMAHRDGTLPPRIYWQDIQGNYDTAHYSELMSSKTGKLNTDYSRIPIPFTSRIISDSVDDIIHMAFVGNKNTKSDSLYFLFFQGGEALYKKGKYIFSDSIEFFDTLGKIIGFSPCQGDFRGIGRNDFTLVDDSNNCLYYPNNTTFSMSGLVNSFHYDTLYAKRENPKSTFSYCIMPMKALPKNMNDSSNDLLTFFYTNYGANYDIQEIRIFKGGKNFGSHRWIADSAAFVIHEPFYYDSKFAMGWGLDVKDCGDMTGTGNRILYVTGSSDGGLFEYEFFYVLGKSIDDKVDMFIGPFLDHSGVGSADTLIGDKDNLPDFLMGHQGMGADNGALFLLHGTNKIPVKVNSVSLKQSLDSTFSHIHVYPNPFEQHSVLTFDNCSASKMHMEVISSSGAIVRQEETPAVDGLQQYALDLSSLAAGQYIVALSCPANGWKSSVNVVKTGAAVKPWSLDLHKMIGK